MRISLRLLLVGMVFAVIAQPAAAGPPYVTDDPVPTDLGRWEIYSFFDGSADRGAVSGAAGFDLNYGPVAGVQLTATLPLDVTTDPRLQVGIGDVEAGIKYRFIEDERSGVSIAIFPRLIFPTGGAGKTSMLLPVWAGIERGKWSLFGGGGYHVRFGKDDRNSAVAAIALTNQVSKGLSLGAEVAHEGADVRGGHGQTVVGGGAIIGLSRSCSLLLSGGPIFEDGSNHVAARLYAALGLNF